MAKRAERRYHLRRMKERARRVFFWYENPKDAEKYANHLAMCSRHCCGNPRHWWKGNEKITRKEQEADLNFDEQIRLDQNDQE